MASLDDVRDDYCDENLPVFLLLGLVSALRRLDALLPSPGAPPVCPEPGGERGLREERFLYLVLGLIAFRGHLHSALTPVRDAGPRAPPGDGVPTQVPGRPQDAAAGGSCAGAPGSLGAAAAGSPCVESPASPRSAATDTMRAKAPSDPLPGLRELLR